jgi:leader peptidase (prepilin peptidase)/N-methyltransferase
VGGEALALIGAGAVGLCLGSFLNVCIIRLPHDDPKARSLLQPPSTCPKCGKRIAWYDNVPVLSWLVLKGKCRDCRNPISIQYPIIEAVVGVLWVAAVLWYGPTLDAVTAALFGTLLLGIAIIDARHQIIPDELSYGGLVLGLALSLGGGASGLVYAVLGAVVGWGLLWIVRLVGGGLLKQEAMGWGDIKVMAVVGAFAGWKSVLLTVFLGALIGSLFYLPSLLADLRRMRRHELPFGVFLAIGAAVAFVFGESLISWYLQFVRK